MNNPLPAQSQTNVDGEKLSLLQKAGKGRRGLGWQLPETTTAENTTSARNIDTPSKMSPDFELSQTPELTEAQPRSISKSFKNPQAMGNRDGKT